MAAIVNDLPNEILHRIFPIATQDCRPSLEVLKTGNDLQDCVAVIDISRVCRRWRDVASVDSSLWPSVTILLDNPSAKTLRRATYFANVCFKRSKDLPLTIVITLSNLSNLQHAHPLLLAVIFREARWSRIAINLTPCPESPESPAILIPKSVEGATGVHGLSLENIGSNLKEFQFNVTPLFTYSMTKPLLGLESLKITCSNFLSSIFTLARWLPLTPKLQEFELEVRSDYFIAYALEQNQQVWLEAIQQFQDCPHFFLPTLRTLNVQVPFLPYFTCPALERYTMEMISWQAQDLTDYLEFIERSGTPPSFRTIEITKQDDLNIEYVRGFLLPTITNLYVASSGAGSRQRRLDLLHGAL